MAGSTRNMTVLAILPRKWRFLTVAGAATVGLACGVGKPALAELWKFSRSEGKSATKAVPPENGFSATIRRLMADSRRAAEQGDHAKAVQLAERAAKISEAAAQAVGPTGECAPQETARFLAETRARRANPISPGSARTVSSQSSAESPSRPPFAAAAITTPKGTGTSSNRQSKSAAVQAAPVVPQGSTVAIAKQPQPIQPSAPAAVKTERSVSTPQSSGLSFTSQQSDSVKIDALIAETPRQQPVQPQEDRQIAQVTSSDSAEDLLVQSRLEAADGNIDRAILLADQAIDKASSRSLFGQGAKSGNVADAIRWREHLVAQQQGNTGVADSSSVQRPIDAVSTSAASVDQKAPATAATELAAAKHDWQSNSETPQDQPETVSGRLWSDDLPPAPAPQANRDHEPVTFRRSPITRQGEWVEASPNEIAEPDGLRAANEAVEIESSEVIPPESSLTENVAPIDSSEPLPELAINEVQDQNSTAEVPLPEEPPIAETTPTEEAPTTAPPAIVDEQVVPIPTEPESDMERPRLKLRPGIQQIAVAIPADPSTTKRPNQATAVRTEQNSSSEIIEANVEPQQDAVRHVPAEELDAITAEDNHAVDSPVQRFPVQRVIQLRKRIESTAALNPGASKQEATTPPSTTQTSKSKSQPFPADAGDWKVVTNEVDRKEPPKVAVAVEPVKRPPLKLRERLPVTIDSVIDPEANSTKVTTKSSAVVRQKAVGQSTMTRWVSAGQTATSKAESSSAASKKEHQPSKADQPRVDLPGANQPSLEPPVAQVRYESPAATSGLDVASIGMKGEAKRPAAEQIEIAPPPPIVAEKDSWYEDGLVRKRAVSSATIHSSSFGLIDQLASAMKVPASTVVSLIGGGGLLLIGFGLIAVRSALRKRHSA